MLRIVAAVKGEGAANGGLDLSSTWPCWLRISGRDHHVTMSAHLVVRARNLESNCPQVTINSLISQVDNLSPLAAHSTTD
jgi:hypothetical protein